MEKNTTTTPEAIAPAQTPSPQVKEDSVATVAAQDAVTTNSDNVIVANVNGKYRRFEKQEHVPAGCRTYSSKAEVRGQLKKQLETIYAYVKGCELKTFKDHDTAVDNLWHAFTQLPVFDPVKDEPEAGEKAKAAKNGKKTPSTAEDKKKSYQKKREENKYVIKSETDKSKKMVGELAPQAQAVVEIIRKDGKAEYSEVELRALMDANKEKLRTRQTAWRIFQYYRSGLISADVLVQQ